MTVIRKILVEISLSKSNQHIYLHLHYFSFIEKKLYFISRLSRVYPVDTLDILLDVISLPRFSNTAIKTMAVSSFSVRAASQVH